MRISPEIGPARHTRAWREGVRNRLPDVWCWRGSRVAVRVGTRQRVTAESRCLAVEVEGEAKS